jgi:hypothetical protein
MSLLLIYILVFMQVALQLIKKLQNTKIFCYTNIFNSKNFTPSYYQLCTHKNQKTALGVVLIMFLLGITYYGIVLFFSVCVGHRGLSTCIKYCCKIYLT